MDMNVPVPLLGSKVTVKVWLLLGPTKHDFGSILKAESILGSGSIAKNSNLNGFSVLSKARFLMMSSSKISPSTFCFSSFWSKMFHST